MMSQMGDGREFWNSLGCKASRLPPPASRLQPDIE
jgi:hypothetical protein